MRRSTVLSLLLRWFSLVADCLCPTFPRLNLIKLTHFLGQVLAQPSHRWRKQWRRWPNQRLSGPARSTGSGRSSHLRRTRGGRRTSARCRGSCAFSLKMKCSGSFRSWQRKVDASAKVWQTSMIEQVASKNQVYTEDTKVKHTNIMTIYKNN
jgi:hypothetical protein